jgi:DNA-binding MarR family transcriptional regulator
MEIWTMIFDTASRHGIVKVDPAEACSNILELTPKGQEMLADNLATWREIDTLITDIMGAEDAAQFAELTRSLQDQHGGKAPGQAAPPDT